LGMAGVESLTMVAHRPNINIEQALFLNSFRFSEPSYPIYLRIVSSSTALRRT
jgi:hypothetical protein